jgi:hypothetical protein
MDFVERVVLRLRAEPGFSRNRHYATFSSPEGRRALRIHRHLRSIERDLEAGGRLTVVREDGRVRLSIAGRHATRTAWLTEAEFRLLRTASPLARAAMGPSGPSPSATG